MPEEFSSFDPVDSLVNEEAIQIFLADAFATGDADYCASVLDSVLRAKGLDEILERTGLAKYELQQLFFSEGVPSLIRFSSLMSELGISLDLSDELRSA